MPSAGQTYTIADLAEYRNVLNSQQRAAVVQVDTPLLVLAGAGSGKTRVITQKIAHLVRKTGLHPEQIAAVTFTNKAAREMRARVGSLLPRDIAQAVHISTFHTLGLRILREDGKALGLRPGFSLLDGADSSNLIKSLLKKQSGDIDADAVRWQISRWKSACLAPQQALSEATADERYVDLYERYQTMLRSCNSADFDDLIGLPAELLEQAECRRKWQARLQYLLVDEYQDTNAAQYRLLRLLIGVRGGLTAVGDDDQSIYAWRGARPENLHQLRTDYPSLQVVKLEQNYRSSGRILRSANQLISHNPHLFEKRLWSELGPGEAIRVLPCKTGELEAETVALQIIDRHWRQKTPWSEFAILYRGNFQARAFEQALRQHQIPYRISGGGSFFDKAEVKDVLAYLRLLVNPRDDHALLRIINVPRREIGATTLEKLARYAAQRQIGLLAACGELGLQQSLQERSARRLQQFAAWHARSRESFRRLDLADALNELLENIAYRSWLRESTRDKRSAERRMSYVDELLDWIKRLQIDEHGQTRKLADILAHLALVDSLDRNDAEAGKDEAVQMSTLHAAKGLEFAHVFLAGMEEELLPHRVSIEDGQIEEERRLAYVGITRAQKTLTLSYAQTRRRHGETIRCEPSRFLDELPAEDLQWRGRETPIDEAERMDQGRSHLAGLRELLQST